MAIPRPRALGQSEVAQGTMQQQVYQRTRGRGYRQRYLEYKRQDWMFRIQLAQTQVTEEYRQSVNYNQNLQESIQSYQSFTDSLRDSRRQTDEAISSNQLQVFSLEAEAYDQRHQMLTYRQEAERDLVADLNIKQGTRSPLLTIQGRLTDTMRTGITWSVAEAEVRNQLIETATTQGLQGAIMTIGNNEGQGSISHRQAALMVADYIMTTGEAREWYGMNRANVNSMVESAFSLDAGSLTGIATDYDDAYDEGITSIANASPIELGRSSYTDAQESLALRRSQLISQQATLDSLISETVQETENLQAELEQRGETPPPDYDAVMGAAMEGYQEPISRNEQRRLNRERRLLATQNRLLDEAPPEMRAIVLAGAEASRRQRLGLSVSDDEETIARATELMAGYGESFDPNDLQTLSEQWARGRYETEWTAANPDATEIYWDSDQIATYQNDLMSAVLGQWSNQYGNVQDAAATPAQAPTRSEQEAQYTGTLDFDTDPGLEVPIFREEEESTP